MPTTPIVDTPVGIHGLHLRLHDAIDLDGYSEFSVEGVVNNIELNGSTTKGILKVWHAARLESTSFKEISSATIDFSSDANDYLYVSEFARYIVVTFEWDHADGGTCDLDALLVAKR